MVGCLLFVSIEDTEQFVVVGLLIIFGDSLVNILITSIGVDLLAMGLFTFIIVVIFFSSL